MGITLLVIERAPKFSSSILIRDTLNINLEIKIKKYNIYLDKLYVFRAKV